MKKYEFIDYVKKDGQWVNLYMSLETGECYTFTDEEVRQIETAEANIERRKMEREQQKVIKARRAKIFKRIGSVALIGVLLVGLHAAIPKTGAKPEVPDESAIVQEDPGYNYKSKLVDLLNAANGEYEDINYRNLYYLYYNAYCSGNNGSLISSLIDYRNEASLLTRDDFDHWYEEGNVDFKRLMVSPDRALELIDYDNIDVFLAFNMCLKKEIKEGRLTIEEYLTYMTPFLNGLEEKNSDIKRVWDYYSEKNTTTNGLIDVKLLCYEDTLKKQK